MIMQAFSGCPWWSSGPCYGLAIADGWDVTRTELEVLRADGPAAPTAIGRYLPGK